MSACDPFEEAITLRSQGALPPERGPELEDHLAGCEACREFAHATRRVEDVMARHVSSNLALVDWDRVESLLRRERLSAWSGAVGVLLVTALVLPAALKSPEPGAILLLPLLVPIGLAFAVHHARRARRIPPVGLPAEEALTGLRKALAEKVRVLERALWLVPLLFGVMAGTAWLTSIRQGKAEWALALSALLLAPVSAALMWDGLRRTRRELDELA